MNLHRLAARDRRALLWAAGGVFLFLFWTLAASPYLHALIDARDRLTAAHDHLQREQQVIAEAREYPVQWDTGSARLLRIAPRLLSGPSDGAASAALAGHVQRAAELSRVLVSQVEPLPSRDAGNGVTAIELRLQGEGDLEGLLDLLLALESGPKLVRIQQIQLQRSSAAVPHSGQEPDVLSFQLVVTGFAIGAALERVVRSTTVAQGEQ
jgi:hypothetical protein